MSTISQRIRELDDLTAAELAERYEQLHGRPPRVRHRAFLRRRVAWKLQETEFGGLSDRARARLDELINQIDLPLVDPAPPEPRRSPRHEARAPLVGTTLVRRWRGRELRVEVRDDGFEHEGVLYPSLTAAARGITGSHWNGRLFFKLSGRRVEG